MAGNILNPVIFLIFWYYPCFFPLSLLSSFSLVCFSILFTSSTFAWLRRWYEWLLCWSHRSQLELVDNSFFSDVVWPPSYLLTRSPYIPPTKCWMMRLLSGLVPPRDFETHREGIFKYTFQALISLFKWSRVANRGNCPSCRRGIRGKRDPGFHGQASWISCVINLVNTSE